MNRVVLSSSVLLASLILFDVNAAHGATDIRLIVPGSGLEAPDDQSGGRSLMGGLGQPIAPALLGASTQRSAEGQNSDIQSYGRNGPAPSLDIPAPQIATTAAPEFVSAVAASGVDAPKAGQTASLQSIASSATHALVDGGYSIDAGGGLPIGANATIQLVLHYDDPDGWVRRDGALAGQQGKRDASVQLVIQDAPTSNLHLTLLYAFAYNQPINASQQLLADIPAFGADGVLGGQGDLNGAPDAADDLASNLGVHVLSVRGNWSAGAFNITSQTAFLHDDLNVREELDTDADGVGTSSLREEFNELSQEISFQSRAWGKIEYTVSGLFQASQRASTETQFGAASDCAPAQPGAGGRNRSGAFNSRFVEDGETMRLFGSSRWNVTSKLKVEAGLEIVQSFESLTYGQSNVTPQIASAAPSGELVQPAKIQHDETRLNGDLIIQYQALKGILVYSSYSTRLKPGEYLPTSADLLQSSISGSEQSSQPLAASGALTKDELEQIFEVGSKGDFFSHRLRLSLSGFIDNTENYAETVCNEDSATCFLANVPARRLGLKFGADVDLGGGFLIDAGLRLTDATAPTQPINPTTSAPEVTAAGEPIAQRCRLAQSPKAVVKIGLDYQRRLTTDLHLHLRADLHYRSGMFSAAQDAAYAPAMTNLDLAAGVSSAGGHWSFDLVAKNASDAFAEDFAGAGDYKRFFAQFSSFATSSSRFQTVLATVRLSY